MIAQCCNEQMSLPRPIGDPKVVPGGIEDPEVRQAPGTILEILFEWPSCRHDTIALSGDVVNLKNQLHSSGRQPCLMGIRNCSSGRSDQDSAPLHRHMSLRILALILGQAEAKHPRVEVNGGI
jgi:hypothetical protein